MHGSSLMRGVGLQIHGPMAPFPRSLLTCCMVQRSQVAGCWLQAVATCCSVNCTCTSVLVCCLHALHDAPSTSLGAEVWIVGTSWRQRLICTYVLSTSLLPHLDHMSVKEVFPLDSVKLRDKLLCMCQVAVYVLQVMCSA
jgi:hypothetical protein